MSDGRLSDNDIAELRRQVAVHDHRIAATERGMERLTEATHELREEFTASIDKLREEFVGAISDLNASVVKLVGIAIIGLLVERALT